MAVNEETGIFGMDQGCAVHGDEHMRECSMCGAEFCRVCFPKTAVCPDCSEQEEEEEDTEENPDFDDVSNLGELIEDEDADKLTEEGEEIPPEDLVDDESSRGV
jgi:hypothetical protein